VKQFDSDECLFGRATYSIIDDNCLICATTVNTISDDCMFRNWRFTCCQKLVHRFCCFEYIIRTEDHTICPNCRIVFIQGSEINDDDTLSVNALVGINNNAQVNEN
jgi:hypothetical protein